MATRKQPDPEPEEQEQEQSPELPPEGVMLLDRMRELINEVLDERFAPDDAAELIEEATDDVREHVAEARRQASFAARLMGLTPKEDHHDK